MAFKFDDYELIDDYQTSIFPEIETQLVPEEEGIFPPEQEPTPYLFEGRYVGPEHVATTESIFPEFPMEEAPISIFPEAMPITDEAISTLGLGGGLGALRQERREGPSVTKEIGKAIQAFPMQMAETGAAVAEFMATGVEAYGEIFGPDDILARAGRSWGDAAKADRQYWAEKLEAPELAMHKEIQGLVFDKPELMTNPAWVARTTTDAVLSMMPVVIAYLTGGKAVAGVAGGTMEGQQTYGSLIDEGVEPWKASSGAIAVGIVTGVLNATSLDKILGPKTGTLLQRAMKGYLIGGAWEAGTEWLEEPLSAAIEGVARLDSNSDTSDIATIVSGVKEASIRGLNVVLPSFLTAGLLTSFNNIAQVATAEKESRNPTEIRTDRTEAYDKIRLAESPEAATEIFSNLRKSDQEFIVSQLKADDERIALEKEAEAEFIPLDQIEITPDSPFVSEENIQRSIEARTAEESARIFEQEEPSKAGIEAERLADERLDKYFVGEIAEEIAPELVAERDVKQEALEAEAAKRAEEIEAVPPEEAPERTESLLTLNDQAIAETPAILVEKREENIQRRRKESKADFTGQADFDTWYNKTPLASRIGIVYEGRDFSGNELFTITKGLLAGTTRALPVTEGVIDTEQFSSTVNEIFDDFSDEVELAAQFNEIMPKFEKMAYSDEFLTKLDEEIKRGTSIEQAEKEIRPPAERPGVRDIREDELRAKRAARVERPVAEIRGEEAPVITPEIPTEARPFDEVIAEIEEAPPVEEAVVEEEAARVKAIEEEPKYAKEPAQLISPKSTTTELESQLDKDLGKRGRANLKLEVVQTVDDLMGKVGVSAKEAADITTRGVFDPTTGKSYLVADNVGLNESWPIALHEGVHKIKAEKGWAGVFGKQAPKIMADIDGKLQESRSVWDVAEKKAIDAGVAEEDIQEEALKNFISDNDKSIVAWREAEQKAIDAGTIPEDIREETIAYYLTNNANREQSLWQRIVNAIRAWAANMGITRTITDDDIQSLAEFSIQRAARKRGVAETRAVPEVATKFAKEPRKRLPAMHPDKLRELVQTLDDNAIDVVTRQRALARYIQQQIPEHERQGLIAQITDLGVPKTAEEVNQYFSDVIFLVGQKYSEITSPDVPWRTDDAAEPISQNIYEENRELSGEGIIKKSAGEVSQIGKDIVKGIDRYMGAVSTRLGNINIKLKKALRDYEFHVGVKEAKDAEKISGFLDKRAKMSKEDTADFDLARKNIDTDKINSLVEKYDMVKEYEKLRDVLNSLHKRALAVKYDVGFIEDFHPRALKDQKGYLEYIQGSKDWPTISRAIKEKEAELGRYLDVGEKAQFVNTLLRGYGQDKITLSKPGTLKERRIDFVTPELNQFYMDSDAALVNYLHQTNSAIEARRFFGKGAKPENIGELDNTIGFYVLDLIAKGELKPDHEKEVSEILQARFNEIGTRGVIGLYKNLSYIDTMGSMTSAITQIGDLAWSLYRNGIFKTTGGLIKASVGKAEIKREDIGVHTINAEFSDQSKAAKAVSVIFKLTGLEKIDAIGKETLLHAGLKKYQARAKKNPELLRKELVPYYENETSELIEDLKSGNITENVKLLMFNELADFQPIALSEMPQKYLTGGNGRIFYMLKSFTLKQFDIYRREIYHNIAKKGTRVKGIKNLIRLTSAFVAANATADIIKSLLLGRDIDPDDLLIDNLLRLFGISKFVTWKAREEGVGAAMVRQIAPPFKFIDALSKDINKAGDEKGLETVASIPLVGKLYYWWFGKGKAKVERRRKKSKRKTSRTTRRARPVRRKATKRTHT